MIKLHTEEMLQSLDGIQRAEARPFMYTRVQARLQREEANFWSRAGSFMARPAIAFCCLLSVISLNAYFILTSDAPTDDTMVVSNSATDILQNDNTILAVNTNYDINN